MVALLLSATAGLTTIPSVYQGRWSTNSALCKTVDPEGVTITASRVDFYEARGTMKSISEGAKGASGRFHFTSEGRDWDEGVTFLPLPSNRLQLTAIGRTQVFYRCS